MIDHKELHQIGLEMWEVKMPSRRYTGSVALFSVAWVHRQPLGLKIAGSITLYSISPTVELIRAKIIGDCYISII